MSGMVSVGNRPRSVPREVVRNVRARGDTGMRRNRGQMDALIAAEPESRERLFDGCRPVVERTNRLGTAGHWLDFP